MQTNLNQYYLVTRQYGFPIFLSKTTLDKGDIYETPEGASKWSYKDTVSGKLDYYKYMSGWDGLQWEKI